MQREFWTLEEADCSMDRPFRYVCGEVAVNYRSGSTVIFKWSIPNFSQLFPGTYYSAEVNYLNMEWCLQIHKRGYGEYLVYLCREQLTPGTPESARFTIRWKTPDGGEGDILRDRPFPQKCERWGEDIDRQCRLLSADKVTFTCTLEKGDSSRGQGVSHETRAKSASCSNARKDEHVNPGPKGFLGVSGISGCFRETRTKGASCSNGRKVEHVNPGCKGVSCGTQTEDTGLKGVSRETQTEDARGRNEERPLEDISILREHFKNLLLTGDDHDVLIKIEDKQFGAHKNILKARSPVFAAMFTNEMAESAEGSVTIEDCDPEAFGELLHYVYTGEVDIASASSALGLYYAGDKYDFPRLKEICVEFLKNSFTTTTVFDVIRLAATHGEEELLHQGIVYFAENLEEVMLTVEWQRFLLANPIQANEMSLKAVQCLKTHLRRT